MVTPVPPKKVQRRPGKPRPLFPTPPAALTLVAAALAFDAEDDAFVHLTFGRAVDAAGLVASQITVADAAGTGFVYAGTGVSSQPAPQTVVVALAPTGSAEGATVLNASAWTGIVADDDGAAWPGVSDLALPFP